MLSSFFEKLHDILKKGDVPSPFLFLYENAELFHSELSSETQYFLGEQSIDVNSFFVLEDSGASLGIKEVKIFLSQAELQARFGFQIFLIENIARMTPQAQNACLKFFEEPGKGNIVFLTAESESGILETVVSRVQVITPQLQAQALTQFSPKGRDETTNTFYISMIENHVAGTSDELLRYFSSGKYETEEYMKFLYALMDYISLHGDSLGVLETLEADMQGIMKHNFSARYIVDTYIMKLGKKLG